MCPKNIYSFWIKLFYFILLNLPQYPRSNNYFSIPEENIYSIIGGLWIFFILDEVVFILFLCYITVTCRYTIVFTANIASPTSKRHLSACNIWTFSRRFSRNLTPRAPKKYFNSSCVLFIFNNLVKYYLVHDYGGA